MRPVFLLGLAWELGLQERYGRLLDVEGIDVLRDKGFKSTMFSIKHV
jgi:hypothetical protein